MVMVLCVEVEASGYGEVGGGRRSFRGKDIVSTGEVAVEGTEGFGVEEEAVTCGRLN